MNVDRQSLQMLLEYHAMEPIFVDCTPYYIGNNMYVVTF